MQTRVYTDKIEIDNNSTKEFWENRANNINNLQTVLLGSDKTGIEQNTRNEHEKLIVESVVKQIQNPRILDIGCGIGRWAENLINQFDSYTGVDFSEGFINFASEKFANYSNIKFYNNSILNLDKEILNSKFNFIICTGVLMYVNDSNLSKFFKTLKQMIANIHKVYDIYIYTQESISLMDVRLTLNQFESKDLQTNYNAIYRTKQEYEEYFKTSGFDIIKTDLLLDNKSGAREETNAQYWILKG